MAHRIQRAHPPLQFIPDRFNPIVLYWGQKLLLPIAMRLRLRPWLPAGIAQVDTVHVERLVDLYQQFQAGKIRLLLAFRHAEVDDPLSLIYLLSHSVPQAARHQDQPLQFPVHAYFIYDRGMTIWAGAWLGWMFSLLGGIPIHRGKKLDRVGIRTARELFMNGKLPLMAAPEGATNGHSEIVSPLEPGVAQLGFWCVQDLKKANRPETVWIVPIGIQYFYVQAPWKNLDRLLSQLEHDTGLAVQSTDPTDPNNREERYYQRLLRLADHLLTQMEQFYRRFLHQELPELPTPDPFLDLDQALSGEEVLELRLQRVLDRALKAAEQHFNLPAQGTVIERCRRLEEAGWNDIYREDLPNLQQLSPFERGLADWLAEEAELRNRHMRLVESFVAVTGTHIQEKPTVERFAELALLMFDLVARIKGDKNPSRPRLGWRRSRMTIGEPICVSDRESTYQTSRTAAKQAVNDLTEDLHRALEKLIV